MNRLLHKYRYAPKELEEIRRLEDANIPEPFCREYERPDKSEAIAAYEARRGCGLVAL